jgi:hypothetical protein
MALQRLGGADHGQRLVALKFTVAQIDKAKKGG